MTAPLLTRIRETPRFLRPTASIVLITFLMLILEPLAVAAQNNHPPASAKPSDDGDRRFSATVENIEQHLQRAHDKHSRRQDSTRERSELKRLYQTLQQLDTDERQSFEKIERHLREHHLPAEILDRHREMVEHYDAEQKALAQELDAIDAAGSDAERSDHVQTALKRLKAKSNKPRHQPLDPKNLPFQVPEGKIRAPKETPEELKKLIQAQAPVQVAALELSAGMLAQVSQSSAPTSADLAETEEVQLNYTIKQIAQDLENNPIKIYNWVRNNIEFVPTYGSIQGAQQTYENHKGNAFDIASLLIALLRASNIPARYVYGTIQVPAEQVMNWVGGAATPELAQNLLGQGGIPTTALVSGGKIVAFKMEHLWVDAYVDFIPSHGAKHRTGDTWIPMDASFKQYEYGGALANAVPVPDAQTLITQFSTLGSIDETNATISGFAADDYRVIADPITESTTALLETTAPEATSEQFFGSKSIKVLDAPVLAASLPYQVLATASSVSGLPESLRHKAKIEIFSSQLDLAAENPTLSYTISLPKINGRRLGVKYLPASPADAQVIQASIDSGATAIPAYLIKLKTAIQIDETTVVEGGFAGMGDDQLYKITLSDPQRLNPNPVVVRGVAGDLAVFSIDAIGLEMGSIAGRHRAYVDLDMANNKASLKMNRKSAEEGLFLTALSYWEQYTAFDRMLAQSMNALTLRLPSVGRFAHPAAITYSFGIPKWASYGSTQVNIPRIFLAAAAKDKAQRKALIMASGIFGSSMEGLVLDQVNSRPAGTGVSSIRLFALALAQGQKILSINTSNLETQLSRVRAIDAVKSDIRNAVNIGLAALIPENNQSHHGWSGTGYVLLNTETGEGAYRISEGLNGGGIFGPPTADEQKTGPFAKQGFIGSIGSTAILRQGGSILFNIGPAARALMPLVRTFVGPMTMVAGAVVMAYFAEVSIFMHLALIEELVVANVAVAEDAVDCAESPDDPECSSCDMYPHGKRPPDPAASRTDFWAQLVRNHHACASTHTNPVFREQGLEFTAAFGNFRRSFDTASSPILIGGTGLIGGEVKTTGSTKIIPGPEALGYFLTALSLQIPQQRDIAIGCGFGYILYVQESWQSLLATLNEIPNEKACPSKAVDPPDVGGNVLLQLLLGVSTIDLEVNE